ncbi:(-)-alpha-terpineol synthase [Morella rubra]|uniref:(-)-alpha-terpineol synthase n=1 Tax=Morella rubra TaxID=262757 RepID=A0A6A1V1H1_9ROSI|nr:(-)-alpha-terpineol synthase [Morella rubra]
MDLLLLPSLSNCCFPRLLPSNINASLVTSGSSVRVPRPFQCKAAISEIASHDPIVARRSANYQPSIWHHNYIESLTSEFVRFSIVKDETGQFKASLCHDIKGLLCLYEASFLLIEGESVLEEARDFATKELKRYINEGNKDSNLSTIVRHALELPFHWRMRRFEVRWFIDENRRKKDMNPMLLELAELDFNMVQAVHQEELKQMSRWWKSTCLGEKLSFARDRLIENFIWAVGMSWEPQFGYFRRTLTKINVLLTVIDDVYDVYGTLDELELFTDAVESGQISVDLICRRQSGITARGDVPKSIQCYMKETGATEEEAREYVRSSIAATWKKMNEEGAASSPFSQTFTEIAKNLGRMAQFMYLYGDGHAKQNRESKDRVFSLCVHPIPPHRDEQE